MILQNKMKPSQTNEIELSHISFHRYALNMVGNANLQKHNPLIFPISFFGRSFFSAKILQKVLVLLLPHYRAQYCS